MPSTLSQAVETLPWPLFPLYAEPQGQPTAPSRVLSHHILHMHLAIQIHRNILELFRVPVDNFPAFHLAYCLLQVLLTMPLGSCNVKQLLLIVLDKCPYGRGFSH